MGLRGRKYWFELTRRLGVEGLPEAPALTTTGYGLRKGEAKQLEEAWADGRSTEGEAVAADGKHLRGSRRRGGAALQVLTLVGHRGQQVLAPHILKGGDEAAAAGARVRGVALKGRVVSLDAGRMERPVVKKGAFTLDG